MAEINIEKKKPIWPWILLGLLLAAIVLFFVLSDNDEQSEQASDEPVIEETSSQDEQEKRKMTSLSTFIKTVEEEDGKMGIDHVYTHRALTQMTEAMRAVAEQQNIDINADLDILVNRADSVKQDPLELTHANSIKKAFETANAAFATLAQQAQAENVEEGVEHLETHTENLELDKPTLEQRQEVKGYFDKAAEILQKISNS